MNQNAVESTCHETEGSNLFLRRRRRESSRLVSFRLVVKVSTAICWAESSCRRSGLGMVLGGGGGALATAKVIAKKKQNKTKQKTHATHQHQHTQTTAKLKAHELRGQSKGDLTKQLTDLKNELTALRVAKVTGGAPNKLSKIKVVRKNIARVLTVIHQTQLSHLKEANKGNKHIPLDLRVKKTRAIRRALTKKQLAGVTEKEAKRNAYFPMRKYAVKA